MNNSWKCWKWSAGPNWSILGRDSNVIKVSPDWLKASDSPSLPERENPGLIATMFILILFQFISSLIFFQFSMSIASYCKKWKSSQLKYHFCYSTFPIKFLVRMCLYGHVYSVDHFPILFPPSICVWQIIQNILFL